MSLIYITVGCLTMVWTGVWYFYLMNHPTSNESVYYWNTGLALTGLTLVIIGLTIGHIGRSARQAEASPTGVAAANRQGTEQPAPVATAVPTVPAAPVATNGVAVAGGQPVSQVPVQNTPVQPRV